MKFLSEEVKEVRQLGNKVIGTRHENLITLAVNNNIQEYRQQLS